MAAKLEWIQTPKHVFVVLPAVTLAEGEVQNRAWSADGAYLLVAASRPSKQLDLRLKPNPDTVGQGVEIVAWTSQSRQVRRLWSTEEPSVKVFGMAWLHGTPWCIAEVRWVERPAEGPHELFGLLALNPATGVFAWVPGMDRLEDAPQLFASPTGPSLVAVFLDQPPAADGRSDPTGGVANFWTIGPDARVQQRVRTSAAYAYGIAWSSDGGKWYVGSNYANAKSGSGDETLSEVLDDGSMRRVNATAYRAPVQPEPELVLSPKETVAARRKVRTPVSNLWLSSRAVTFHPDLLLSADARGGRLSPNGEWVFYLENLVAKIRPIVKLTDDQRRELFDQLKQQAMRNAKQCATGLAIYTNDWDDFLPPAGMFGSVEPYLKNQDLMDGFNYTPPGLLNVTQLGNPAATAIGYVEGPDGRAVAYADGHVVWIANP